MPTYYLPFQANLVVNVPSPLALLDPELRFQEFEGVNATEAPWTREAREFERATGRERPYLGQEGAAWASTHEFRRIHAETARAKLFFDGLSDLFKILVFIDRQPAAWENPIFNRFAKKTTRGALILSDGIVNELISGDFRHWIKLPSLPGDLTENLLEAIRFDSDYRLLLQHRCHFLNERFHWINPLLRSPL